ncbi:MAG: peptidase [Bradyrhizobium sp.]|jgi:D-alanyl-D-alanine dipeptidase|nr:peptidase [Bradyrhizobium sp.]
MPALKRVSQPDVAGIHVFLVINRKKDVDGRKTGMAGTSPAVRMWELLFVKTAVITLAVLACAASARAQGLPADFVFLRDIDPTIIQDIRYAGSNNFAGRPLAGYDAAECVVKRSVALALKSIQHELAPQRLSLKMLDCYRPARAVHDMVIWAQNGRETPAERRYNPAFGKAELFRLGYIAEHSGHSTGAALDLTLVDLKADNTARFDPTRIYADCTAPASARAPEGSVDMGTGYDCSDVKGHTAATSITPAQRRWRNMLIAAMARQGFVNYSKEWWHFSLPGAAGPAYDFPVARRRS